jgi:hypothetical protein
MVDICGNAGYSEEFTFTVFPSPANPVVQGVEVTGSGSVELTATGSNLRWYDAEAAATPIFEGNPFVTPVLTETTTYWVEDFAGSEPVTAMGGETTTDAGQYHDNSTRWLIFDAHEDLVLVSVKVFANGAGEREIGVIDAGGNPVGNNVTVNVPDGESTVQLGIEVPAGTGYGLRCYTGNPQLWRDGLGSTLNYPYALGELATITQSTAGQQNATNYYYFFYDWVVETPSVSCPSDRVPVTVTVVGVEEAAASLLQAFPNPASGEVVMTWPAVEAVRELVIADATGRLVNQIPVATAAGRTVLDVSGWAPGVYSVSAGTSVVRLVVQ